MKRWKARTLATVLSVATLLLVWTTPALANPLCQYHVLGSENTIMLCIEWVGYGYDARVTHSGGPWYIVDFNLITSDGRYGDEGAFWLGPGETRIYTFSVGCKSWAETWLYWQSGQPEFSPRWSGILWRAYAGC